MRWKPKHWLPESDDYTQGRTAMCLPFCSPHDYMFTYMELIMSNIEYLRQQLEYAEEQLMIADDMHSKITWGNRCDALEAALADAEV